MRRVFTGVFFGLLLISFNPQVTSAQSEPTKKLELGAQFVLIPQNRPKVALPLFSGGGGGPWDPGVGGRITFNATRVLSFEAELNFLTREELPREARGRKTQGLFGVKAGRRSDKFGVFGKARPGFMRFGSVFDCLGEDVQSPGCGGFAHNEFAVDLGGVVEYYPTPRTIFRVDVGDTIIRFRDRKIRRFLDGPDVFVFVPIEGGTVHNLQINIGFAVRF